MSKEIKLLKNNDNKDQTDVEWAKDVYDYLVSIGIGKKRAFSIIYFLQERFPVIPDHIEQCSICGELYDTYSQGHHSELTGKFYCSESCEPPGLYKRELKREEKQDAPFMKWAKEVKKEQNNYPFLKGKEISESHLRRYFNEGNSPIDTLNDILTIV